MSLVRRCFSVEGQDPLTTVEWGTRQFGDRQVEVPASWVNSSAKVVSDKFMRAVRLSSGDVYHETSVKQVMTRVPRTIARWGMLSGLLTPKEAVIFGDELTALCVGQYMAFNSPVWFNVGTTGGEPGTEQCSACFINSVDDNMESILDLGQREGRIYKHGSGSGVNYSRLRSSREGLSTSGTASGPVPFIDKDDRNAGAIKSGGTTRRAAKMVILNADHGDVLEFVAVKQLAERMARTLIGAGYDADFRSRFGVYGMLPFQNANHSVRVTDEFMRAVENDGPWHLLTRDGKVLQTIAARDLWNLICVAAHDCGDPGLQFDTNVNNWHTCPKSGRIDASNPCQPASALMLTPEGITTLGSVDVGSTIWSGSKWTRVKRKIHTGIKPVFRFHTRAGIFTGTDTHKVLSSGLRVEVRDAETIDIAESAEASATPLTGLEQTILDGLVLGDGSAKYANDRRDVYITLCVGQDDRDYFASEVGPLINPVVFDHKYTKYPDHRVQSTLSPQELPPTYLREIPDRFIFGTSSQIRAFLRGLYSANGSICGNRVTLKAASFPVIERAQVMLSAIGISSYYTVNKPKEVVFSNGTYMCKQSYDLHITRDRRKFAALIGFIQGYKTERLAAACVAEDRPWKKTTYEIVEVEAIGEQDVWDIEVEAEEHTYWTAGLLVSNCSEYMFLNDSACNLASLNLRRFQYADGSFDVERLGHAIDTTITAQEIIVGASSYPTELITRNSHRFRPLGLGYANLGSALMCAGLPYDSDEGRDMAAGLTALMGGRAYLQSACLASRAGAFEGYAENEKSMQSVISAHRRASEVLRGRPRKDARSLALADHAMHMWEKAYLAGAQYGYRNSQVTVLAPTGTISFLMGCDTTGIEPDIALSRDKHLVGGGTIRMVSEQVRVAMHNLGYNNDQVQAAMEAVVKTGSLEGHVRREHLPVFDCALPDPVNGRCVRPEGHVDMMVVAQPFLSGAISKTVNAPGDCTPQYVSELYMRAWRGGLKAIAVYRDGCKGSQPVTTMAPAKAAPAAAPVPTGPVYRPMPDDVPSMKHKVRIGDVRLHIHVGFRPEDNGEVGEVYIRAAKQGTIVNGLLDAFGVVVSKALQWGMPLAALVEEFRNNRFEPSGITGNPRIPMTSSIVDYVFRYLDGMQPKVAKELPEAPTEPPVGVKSPGEPCPQCGATTIRTGSCKSCPQCFWNGGCG